MMITLAKQKLRGKLLEAMRHRLTQMSREQALQRPVPRASGKKPSEVKKAALKQKKMKTAFGRFGHAAKPLADMPSGESASVASEIPQAEKAPRYSRVCRVARQDHPCGKSGKCIMHNLLCHAPAA